MIGLPLLALGFYFLVMAPGEAEVEIMNRTVVNMHRLALGQTSSICGSIFLAAALRPR
jgi:hypothetical protein